MKKTLLMAAAALAASVISSQAQVYSQNIVGYVNIPETAGQFSLEAPALDLDGTGTNSTVSTIYTAPSINDSVFVFNTSLGAFDTLTYQIFNTGSRAHPVLVTNWFDENGNPAQGYSINPGQGVFFLPAVNETNTIVGVALTGVLTNQFVPTPGTYNLLSSKIPIGGGLDSVLGYVPNISDSVLIYTGGSYDTYTYQVLNTGSRAHPVLVTNWFDSSAIQGEPVVNVGQGFWILPAAANTWTEVLTNN